MMRARKVWLARRAFVINLDDNDIFEVTTGDFSWTVATAADGQPEIVERPEPNELPSYLTDTMVMAAVDKFGKKYHYGVRP